MFKREFKEKDSGKKEVDIQRHTWYPCSERGREMAVRYKRKHLKKMDTVFEILSDSC